MYHQRQNTVLSADTSTEIDTVLRKRQTTLLMPTETRPQRQNTECIRRGFTDTIRNAFSNTEYFADTSKNAFVETKHYANATRNTFEKTKYRMSAEQLHF